jgi:hypothetical protein
MPADRPVVLSLVAGVLTEHHVSFALIGAAALAIHGVARSTLDIDLLVIDARVLSESFWSGLPPAVRVDIRTGDAADPLAGVVRLRADGERDVDIVVGRGAWQADLIARAEPTPHGALDLPVVQVADLVLLKLYAGGSQDRWDIEQLLARPDRHVLAEQVEARLAPLPDGARTLWTTLR